MAIMTRFCKGCCQQVAGEHSHVIDRPGNVQAIVDRLRERLSVEQSSVQAMGEAKRDPDSWQAGYFTGARDAYEKASVILDIIASEFQS